MGSIISITAALVSICCAVYCSVQVNYIKKETKNNGDRNVNLDESSAGDINTGDM